MALTTLAKVKAHRGITDAANDALLTTLIDSVSQRMKSFLRRAIEAETIVAELHDGHHLDTLTLRSYPVTGTVVVRENGVVIPSTEYVVLAALGQLVRAENGCPGVWEWGRLNHSVDYPAGFAEVPADLELAATRQVLYQLLETVAGDKRLGNRGSVLDAGGTRDYVTTEWLPGVLATLESYRDGRVY